MEAKRLGGAFLTATVTGVGIMVPYTFPTMPVPVMALIWAALVFMGIVGLVLALKPGAEAASPPSETRPAQARPVHERTPFFETMIGKYLEMLIFMFLPMTVIAGAMALIRWLSQVAT